MTLRGAVRGITAPSAALLAPLAALLIQPALPDALAPGLAPGALHAQITLAEAETFRLTLGGYLRSLSGLHDSGFDLPIGDRRSAFTSQVARVRWRLAVGDRVTLDVHNRVQGRVSTAAEGFGESVAGFGVSVVPGRPVDLESVWIDDERLRVWHDVDRLALSVRLPTADLTVGRQAITWGEAFLFPVADLWAQFSPFELDTEEKPGTDAVRVLAYPLSGMEVDAVAAARGRAEDFSLGARASFSLPSADLWMAGGKLWNQAMAMAGITWLLDVVRLRVEAVLPRHLDEERWLDPRATLGVDRIGSRLTLTAEYHFNGLGAADAERYLERLTSEPFARGESYFLGRHYLGGVAAWTVDREERVSLSGSVLVNLQDPSAAIAPIITWDLGQATDLSVGGLFTAGRSPAFPGPSAPPGTAPAVRLGSEYGTYGHLGYTRFSIYF